MKPIAEWTKRDWNSLIYAILTACVLHGFLDAYGASFLDGVIDGFTLAGISAPS